MFVGVLVLLLFVLAFIIIARKPHFSLRYIAFQVNHIGLFLLLAAGIMGAADKQEYKTVLTEGYTTDQVYRINGRK